MKSVLLLVAVAAIALPGVAAAKGPTDNHIRDAYYKAMGVHSGQLICQVNPADRARIRVGTDYCAATGKLGDPCRCASTAGWIKGTVKALP